MIRRALGPGLILLALAGLHVESVFAQLSDSHQNLPEAVPPPLPPKSPPKDAPVYDSIVPDSEEPWGISEDLLRSLQEKVAAYHAHAQEFICDEEVRRADYDASGEVSREKISRYAYLLMRGSDGERFRELRQDFDKQGRPRPGAVQDAEPFPPAYMWVYLFSPFHRPFFEYRQLSTDFDGFDLVHEIQFRGSLPFSDGRDIRQWEGRVLIDAITLTPIEIEAEPRAQQERIQEKYRIYNQSFSILGMRTKPRPLGYRARVEFRYRKELEGSDKVRLTFPTDLRYDTIKAVSPTQIVPVRASTRKYTNYRFIDVRPDATMGDVVPKE